MQGKTGADYGFVLLRRLLLARLNKFLVLRLNLASLFRIRHWCRSNAKLIRLQDVDVSRAESLRVKAPGRHISAARRISPTQGIQLRKITERSLFLSTLNVR